MRRLRLENGPANMGFVVDKPAVQKVLLLVLSIVSQVLHTQYILIIFLRTEHANRAWGNVPQSNCLSETGKCQWAVYFVLVLQRVDTFKTKFERTFRLVLPPPPSKTLEEHCCVLRLPSLDRLSFWFFCTAMAQQHLAGRVVLTVKVSRSHSDTEHSAPRRNLYLITHNTHHRHPCARRFRTPKDRRPTP